MPYLMLRHEVDDFDAWKQAFDAQQDARQQVGLEGGYLLQGLESFAQVVVLLAFDQERLENVRAYLNSADFAQLAGHTKIDFLNDAVEV